MITNTIEQYLIRFILLISRCSYLTSETLREDVDNNDPGYQAFMQRQITNEYTIVEEHIRLCTDKQELTRVFNIIEELIEKIDQLILLIRKLCLVTVSLLQIGKVELSYLMFILAHYYHEILSSVMTITSSITVVELQDHMLNRLNVLMQLDSTQIREVFNAINDN